jgi:vancomycin resistance protein YoaR
MSDTKQYFTTSSTQTAKLTTISFAAAGFSCLIAGILLLIYLNAKSHLPLNTTVNGIEVGNMTVAEAKNKIETELLAPPLHQVTIRVDDVTVASSSSQLQAKYAVDQAILPLVGVPADTRTRDKVYTVLRRYFTPHEARVDVVYADAPVTDFIGALQRKVDFSDEEPRAQLAKGGVVSSLSIFAGKQGRAVEVELLRQTLNEKAGTTDLEVTALVASTGAVLSQEQAEQGVARASKLVGKTVAFTREGIPFTLSDKELVSFLRLPEGTQTTLIADEVLTWEEAVNRPPQEPEFAYDKETLQVTKFTPPRNGLTLAVSKTTELVVQAIGEHEANSDPAIKTIERKLPLAQVAPKKSLADFNDIGIKERIGFGESYYAHSIPNRIHNVALATKKVSLHIIKPGEQFSFNTTIGDISAATGFKSAYVIQGNRTVLGDGGGVCQVSSTLFRAVLNAGLEITRRLPHSYRVSYYELNSKPGIDATVYSGETDFRFRNDTNHAILIYGEADSKNLYMYYELYGTSDGRTAEIVDHKTWNFRPAPPPVYIPDPSLPPGKTVQVDWAAAGISASFKNIVKDKNGKVIREEEYKSNYKPWSAKYLKGI